MKLAGKLTSGLCSAAVALSAAAANVSAAEENDWKGIYKAFLYDELKLDDREGQSLAFSIFDIDANGTPELILSEGDVHLSQCRIYTVSHGELTLIEDEFGSSGVCFCLPAKHYLISTYIGMGAEIDSYFSLKGTKLSPVISFYNDEYAVKDSGTDYTIDDKKVTAEEYKNEYAKYFSADEICLGRTYPLSESSIKYAVTGYKSYKKAYGALLREVYADSEWGPAVFSLMDITGDKKPELFVRSGVTTDIYTFADGRVQYMRSEYLHMMNADSAEYSYGYSSGGKMLVMRAVSEKDSARSYTYLKYGRNGLTEQVHICCGYNADGEYVYEVNGKEVTEEEYEAALKKYSRIKFKYRTAKKMYSVEESEIKRMLS
ncbi:MAG: hypothetical protein II773_08580 [Oscillospiraceae bacterium]|nr:hypothetical protein [Oscillospiraceae bacterium]